jgi:hypothetical protein
MPAWPPRRRARAGSVQVELRALDETGRQRAQQWAQEDDLVGDLQETHVALDRVDGDAQGAGDLGVGEGLRGARRQQVLGEHELVEVGDAVEVGKVSLEIGAPEVAQPGLPVLGRELLERGIATPGEVVLRPPAPGAPLVGGRGRLGQPAHGGLALVPDPVERGRRHLVALDALHERQRPQLEQGGSPGQGLAYLLEQEELGRAEEQEPALLAAVGEELDGVGEARLLLNLVDDHEARAMVEPADGIGGQSQSLVGVVEGEVGGVGDARCRQEVAHQRRLASGARRSGR